MQWSNSKQFERVKQREKKVKNLLFWKVFRSLWEYSIVLVHQIVFFFVVHLYTKVKTTTNGERRRESREKRYIDFGFVNASAREVENYKRTNKKNSNQKTQQSKRERKNKNTNATTTVKERIIIKNDDLYDNIHSHGHMRLCLCLTNKARGFFE